MSSSINLASPVVKQNRPVEKLLIISACVFIAVFILSASLLGYLLYLRNQSENLAQDEDKVTAQINANPQQKVNALVLKNRLNDISKILANRGNINSQIQAVIELIPSSLEINTFTIDDTKIEVGLNSSNIADFNTFLENDLVRLQSDRDPFIKRSNIDTFQVQDKSPRYHMEVSFDINK